MLQNNKSQRELVQCKVSQAMTRYPVVNWMLWKAITRCGTPWYVTVCDGTPPFQYRTQLILLMVICICCIAQSRSSCPTSQSNNLCHTKGTLQSLQPLYFFERRVLALQLPVTIAVHVARPLCSRRRVTLRDPARRDAHGSPRSAPDARASCSVHTSPME